MFDIEQQLKWGEQAPEMVKEAAQQNGIDVPPMLERALITCVRVHKLSQAGLFELVEAYANTVKQERGEIPNNEVDYSQFKD